jgi:ribosomal protein S18 acetylase RimI-like enzyme
MLIRRIHPEECESLARITLAAYRQLSDGEPVGPYERQLLDVEARANDSEVYVALDDEGILLGGVTFVPGPERAMAEFHDPEGCGIRMLATDPALQGRGAGRALVQACIERARELGRERIILHSAPAMTRAQSLYLRMGFARAPELDEFIHEEPDAAGEPLHLKAFCLNL